MMIVIASNGPQVVDSPPLDDGVVPAGVGLTALTCCDVPLLCVEDLVGDVRFEAMDVLVVLLDVELTVLTCCDFLSLLSGNVRLDVLMFPTVTGGDTTGGFVTQVDCDISAIHPTCCDVLSLNSSVVPVDVAANVELDKLTCSPGDTIADCAESVLFCKDDCMVLSTDDIGLALFPACNDCGTLDDCALSIACCTDNCPKPVSVNLALTMIPDFTGSCPASLDCVVSIVCCTHDCVAGELGLTVLTCLTDGDIDRDLMLVGDFLESTLDGNTLVHGNLGEPLVGDLMTTVLTGDMGSDVLVLGDWVEWVAHCVTSLGDWVVGLGNLVGSVLWFTGLALPRFRTALGIIMPGNTSGDMLALGDCAVEF